MDIVISLASLLTVATVATIKWAGPHFGHALAASSAAQSSPSPPR